MENKTIICIGLMLLFLEGVNAQVEYKKPVSASSTYSKKVIYTAPEKILVERFNVNFITSGWVAKGTGSSGVGIAAFLQLDEKLAQEIADQTYAYLKDQFEANGFEMSVYNMSDVEANKVYQKSQKKDNVTIRNGGVAVETTKMASKGDSKMSAAASEVIQVTFNSLGSERTNFGIQMIPLGSSCVLAFDLTFGFLETSTSGGSIFNIVSVEPHLSIIDNGGVRTISHYDKKGKLVMVWFDSPEIRFSGSDWIAGKEEKKEMYGSSLIYNLNKEAYKKACLSMTKTYIDQMIVAFDTERTPKK